MNIFFSKKNKNKKNVNFIEKNNQKKITIENKKNGKIFIFREKKI
jgi:hypothetical protein